MTKEIEMLKGSLDTLMSVIRTRDYKKVSEIVDEIKKALDELEPTEELEIYKEFHNTIKNKVRNLGKTNVLTASEIDEEIIKAGNKLEELKNGKHR